MRRNYLTAGLAAVLIILSICSIFVGVIDISPGEILRGEAQQLEIMVISRLPRLFAILCTGAGMSVAGLIMQQVCMNKFISPWPILDLACLDILNNLGLGDRVVGSASTSIDYLEGYMNNKNIVNLGTIKEADLEAVMSCEPDIIFIGGRLSSSYDALSEIAPVVYLATDSSIGVVESTTQNALTIAKIFGLEDEIKAKTQLFTERIEALKATAVEKNAVIGMCTSGSFNLLGDTGRCSIIGTEIGFENIGGNAAGSQDKGGQTATHGNEASFELVGKLNPQYIFVLDRDAAIGTDGAKLAEEIMDNELVNGTDAAKNGNVIILEHPAVWYTAEGGITALDVMLSDLESALLK